MSELIDRTDYLREQLVTKLTVSIPLAAEALGLSRGSGYAAVRTGEIPTVGTANRKNVPTSWLRKQLGIAARDASR
jgi:hypothetical protein